VTGPPLAYWFWHSDAAATVGSEPGAPDYDGLVRSWHAALAATRPAGLVEAWTWRLDTPPWLPGWPSSVRLDVYVVEDWRSLGTLNDAAPRGPTGPAHDRIAVRSAHGSGAVMACRSGTAGPQTPGARLTFCDKRPGEGYESTVASLGGDERSVWVRQMVLGAGPEIVVVDSGHPGEDLPGQVWASPAAMVAGGA
jgi:hypothetical protein